MKEEFIKKYCDLKLKVKRTSHEDFICHDGLDCGYYSAQLDLMDVLADEVFKFEFTCEELTRMGDSHLSNAYYAAFAKRNR